MNTIDYSYGNSIINKNQKFNKNVDNKFINSGDYKLDDINLYYVKNNQNSIVKELDSNGKTVSDVKYQDFGRTLDIKDGPSYTGEDKQDSGLLYLRARFYHPGLGQFVSLDTYKGEKENILSQNRYAYTLNNPYKYTDPSGYKPNPNWGKPWEPEHIPNYPLPPYPFYEHKGEVINKFIKYASPRASDSVKWLKGTGSVKFNYQVKYTMFALVGNELRNRMKVVMKNFRKEYDEKDKSGLWNIMNDTMDAAKIVMFFLDFSIPGFSLISKCISVVQFFSNAARRDVHLYDELLSSNKGIVLSIHKNGVIRLIEKKKIFI